MIFTDFKEQLKSIKDSYVPVNYKSDCNKIQEDQLKSTLYATIINPLKIEYYFWLWFIYSLYAISKMIVFIPFQLLVGIFNTLLSIFHICLSRHITFFSVITLIAAYIFVQQQSHLLDPSYMYHTFRGQSTLKLYGLIFAIQVSEKICTMTGKYLYLNIKVKLQNPSIQLWRITPEMIACFFYTITHAYCLFLQYNIFMVVMNGSMQNFIIFAFVTNLTKMKSSAFKKYDSKSYLGQINFDAKDRLQKTLYIILFQVSQWNRDIPQIGVKLLYIYCLGAIIEHIKHVTVLIQSGQINEIDKMINTMFHKLYVSRDERTFIKCLNNDFTVIPLTVLVVKLLRIIVYVHYTITNQVILISYSSLLIFVVSVKILMIIIRKLDLLGCAKSSQLKKIESLKELGE